MKSKTIIARIEFVEYKCTSYYGNPSYYAWLIEENGAIHRAFTGSNCAIGYGISSFNPCLYYEFTYHYTRAGSMVLTNWKIAKHGECLDSHDI